MDQPTCREAVPRTDQGGGRNESAGYDALVKSTPAILTGLAALFIGLIAIPVVSAIPAPIRLCTLRPPFECITAPMSGSQYVLNDGPTALAWLIISLVLAPLFSLAGTALVSHGRIRFGRILAAAAIIPNLLHFFGTYSIWPFHPLVLLLTIAAFGLVWTFPPVPLRSSTKVA